MRKNIRWRWGVLAATLMALAALVPQAHLRRARGREWQGAYAYFYSDEPAYAAYVNALIDSRPRRTDPYTGADDRPGAPLAESLFSIQFFPAYLLALPARALGLSASTVFILLMPLVAAALSLAIYGAAASVTGDERAAFATVFVVLGFGILVSGQGFFVELLGGFSGYVFLPFLRRYVPGVPLVFFFAFCGALWRALACGTERARLASSLAAGAFFAVLVYSYFYHWTAAAALAFCYAALTLAARPGGRRATLLSLAVFTPVALLALAPYLYLVTRRAPASDEMQALTRTHAPDLLRGVEGLAALTLVALAWGARRGLVRPRDRAVIFTASLALSVLAVFNQQVLTGLSLQPMHYEQYVGNYAALLAAALAATIMWQGRGRLRDDRSKNVSGDASETVRRRFVPRRVWIPVAFAGFAWVLGESATTTRNFAPMNLKHDDWFAVTKRLDALAHEARRAPTDPYPVVFNPDDFRLDHVPADGACAVLWAPHTFAFTTLSRAENKNRVFQFLHFAGVAPADFAASGRDRGFLQFSIFGWERANPRLAVDFKPVTPAEIAAEGRNYAEFVAALANGARPPLPLIDFVVASDDQPFSHANLERFYTLEAIERVGRHTIYRAHPKQP
ncbi:MAG: hypothetical protein LC785_13205 [Acidobacteria bacterium]|nr:hypothetical protein [Acidobacteriota bacterium]MCA1642873.1 hypothetical protein [Acidobacteriota bacterium]